MQGKTLRFLSVRWGAMLVMALSLMILRPVPAGAGQVQQPPPGIPQQPQLPADATRDQPVGPSPARLEHMREDERRKRLLADTARLVELSTELKTDVEKSSKDELSLDVVRKAAEIEKLAHDVKERMKS